MKTSPATLCWAQSTLRAMPMRKRAIRGGSNRIFGKLCFYPLPKRGRFDENGENDEFAVLPTETKGFAPPKTTEMTKMAGVTQAKAWFRKSRVCSSLSNECYTQNARALLTLI